MKFEAKRRISVQQRKKDTGGGQGPPDLSAFDERMAAIIGQSSLSGIIDVTNPGHELWFIHH